MSDDPAGTLNAWMLPSAMRHEGICQVVGILPIHQSLKGVNDRDPNPLFYQLDAENPRMFRHERINPPAPPIFRRRNHRQAFFQRYQNALTDETAQGG